MSGSGRIPRSAAAAALQSLSASAPPTRASMNRPWACTGRDPTCTKSYVEKKALDKHIYLKHDGGGAVCPYCKAKQPDTRVKPEHLKRCKRKMEEMEDKEMRNAIEVAERMAKEAAEALLKQLGC